MPRILLLIASAAVGVVAGYLGPKLVACCRSDSPTLLPFPSRTQRQTRRSPVAGVPSNNVPDGVDHDDR